MKILVTVGPTREPIDAVRFISNRSSGKMGVAIALAAIDQGHQVTLLHGPGVPVEQLKHPQCKCFPFESSAQLKQLLDAHWPGHDTLIMAAAVADYRPVHVVEGKLPRQSDSHQTRLTIELQPTPDLVALMAQSRKPGQKIVAFALEEIEKLETRATEKMRRKGVDAIVANPLGTMESQGITAIWLTATGDRLAPGRMSKTDFATWLIQRIQSLHTTTPAH